MTETDMKETIRQMLKDWDGLTDLQRAAALAQAAERAADAIPAIEVGEFIRIPAWNVEGQVLKVRAASYGSGRAVEVLLQSAPDAAGRWYRFEPTEVEVL
jgi:hypothetical protein